MIKGIESFVYVLIAGLGIFLIVSLTSISIDGFISSKTENDKEYLLNEGSIKTTIKNNKIYYFDKFLYKDLGNIETNKRKIFIGDVNVGKNLQYGIVKKEPLFEVYNGLFGRSSKEIFFETNEGKKVRISFIVNRTNRYGNLIVLFNGKEIFNNVTQEGERILIDVEDNVKDKNTIIIKASSSLPKIWAPTKYEILDLIVEVLDYKDNKGYIEFELLPEEYKGLNKVELRFNVIDTNNYKPLYFVVNGKQVFYDMFESSAQPHVVWLYRKDNLKAGINVLKLFTDTNSYYKIKNFEIIIDSVGNYKTSRASNTFVISQEEYEFIDKNKDILEGIVEIKTNNILLDKGIVVYINGARYVLNNLRKYDINLLTFDISLLKSGRNEIIIETEGMYDIEYIKIGIRKVSDQT